MYPVPFKPGRFEGLFFALSDLQAAMAWVSIRPRVRLSVKTCYLTVPEVIEVYPPGSGLPRWRLWRDRAGRLHVDDWTKGKFNLPYSTVPTALRFIDASLSDGPGRGPAS
jgi:hypothetical protein